MVRILFADDDPRILDFVKIVLTRQNYQVLAACHGEEALEIFFNQTVDLVILDIMMPKLSGLDVCLKIRQSSPLVPIIFLSARSDIPDRIKGLRLGADDYIVKPFNSQELLARVETALRRSHAIQNHQKSPTFVTMGYLNLDHHLQQAYFNRQSLTLSSTEFKLLALFCEYPDQILSRDFLIQQIWGDGFQQSRTLDNFVGRLRRKLNQAISEKNLEGPLLESVYRVGYQLKTPEVLLK